MLNYNKFIFLFTLSNSLAFAGTMGPADDVFKQSTYIKLGSGGSYSRNINIYADPLVWDASPQGYNSNIGQTAIYSAAVGYNFLPLISADIEFIYRPSYAYSKFQTSTATSTVNFNANKTRYFKLQSNSVMANAYLHGAGLNYLQMNVMNTALAPFIGGGIGVGFNTVSDFHSARTDGVYAAIVPDNLRTSLAWQLSAGLELVNVNNFNLAAGYRYYNGGTFTSNNYTIDTSIHVTPWKGTFAADEFFVTLAYRFPT